MKFKLQILQIMSKLIYKGFDKKTFPKNQKIFDDLKIKKEEIKKKS